MIMLKDGLIPSGSGTVKEITCWRLWRHDYDVIVKWKRFILQGKVAVLISWRELSLYY